MSKHNLTSESDVQKAGWRVREWADAVGLSRSSTFNLLKARQIKFVKYGRSTPPDLLLRQNKKEPQRLKTRRKGRARRRGALPGG
jgi:hypothetical protein